MSDQPTGNTPTDAEVLEAFVAHTALIDPMSLGLVNAHERFKRWLAAHDEQVRADAKAEGAREAGERIEGDEDA